MLFVVVVSQKFSHLLQHTDMDSILLYQKLYSSLKNHTIFETKKNEYFETSKSDRNMIHGVVHNLFLSPRSWQWTNRLHRLAWNLICSNQPEAKGTWNKISVVISCFMVYIYPQYNKNNSEDPLTSCSSDKLMMIPTHLKRFHFLQNMLKSIVGTIWNVQVAYLVLGWLVQPLQKFLQKRDMYWWDPLRAFCFFSLVPMIDIDETQQEMFRVVSWKSLFNAKADTF